MPAHSKRLQVAFYLVEPRFRPEGSPPSTFQAGEFPAAEVLAEIGSLDIASGDYYLETSLFDQVVCFVHGEEAPILGAYTKDVITTPMTEYKGELGHLELREDEGIVDPTFIAFFPNSVAGVLRGSIKAPGAATVAHYISNVTSHDCEFRSLPSSKGSVQARLSRPDPSIHKLVVKARRAVFSRWDENASSVARALHIAGSASSSETAMLELTAGGAEDWRDWWAEIEPTIQDILDVVGDLSVAKLEVKGDGDTINFKRDFVTIRVPVLLESGRLTHYEAARALYDAYSEMTDSISAAIKGWRELNPP